MLLKFLKLIGAHWSSTLPARQQAPPQFSMVRIRGSSSKFRLLPHYLHDHPLITLAVEFSIEDSLPRPQVEFARGDRHDHFMMNQQRLQMRVSIILAGFVMLVVLAER